LGGAIYCKDINLATKSRVPDQVKNNTWVGGTVLQKRAQPEGNYPVAVRVKVTDIRTRV
jgi:hypothetical protein